MKKTIHFHSSKLVSDRSSAFSWNWALLLIGFTVSLSSCSIWETDDWNNRGVEIDDIPENVSGPRPIYARTDAYDIFSDVPRAIINGIGVFEDNGFLFTIDADLGIHVADNSNPSAPRRLKFIQVLGARTATADSDRLYVNNFTDLVTIDISDLENVRVVSRQEEYYQSPPAYPPNFNGFFECYDASRGPLLGWENANLNRPQCRIN